MSQRGHCHYEVYNFTIHFHSVKVLKSVNIFQIAQHTIYPGNNVCQKCGHKSGLWVLHEMINKTYAENMKKIVGAIWELPAKQHSQSSPI